MGHYPARTKSSQKLVPPISICGQWAEKKKEAAKNGGWKDKRLERSRGKKKNKWRRNHYNSCLSAWLHVIICLPPNRQTDGVCFSAKSNIKSLVIMSISKDSLSLSLSPLPLYFFSLSQQDVKTNECRLSSLVQDWSICSCQYWEQSRQKVTLSQQPPPVV